ncbi:MAG TPA: threonine/serine exporter family protein, partial [Blastocatellia bacterium]|nr:threonine/serine exporter family protein [Blastocatellia bacterium]
QVGRLFPGGHLSGQPVPLPGWSQWVALLVSPIAFAVLLKARPRDVGWIVLAGIISFAGARQGGALLGPELGGFVGALVLGVGSNLYGRLLDRTSMVPLVPGLLILVPGTVGFGSLSKFLESDVVSGVATAFKMALIAVALVTGLLLSNVVFPPRRTPR